MSQIAYYDWESCHSKPGDFVAEVLVTPRYTIDHALARAWKLTLALINTDRIRVDCMLEQH
jgi:hypothetical protein